MLGPGIHFWKPFFIFSSKIPGTKYLVPSTWYQVLGTKCLVPSTWYYVLGTKSLVPSTWYQVLGTKYLATFRKRATGHIHTVRAQRHTRSQPRTVRAARAPKCIARRSYYGPSGRGMAHRVVLCPTREPQSHYGPSGRIMAQRVALGTSVEPPGPVGLCRPLKAFVSPCRPL